MRRVLLGLVAAVVAVTTGAAACAAAAPSDPLTSAPAVRPVVLGEEPHDPTAFTQGLELSPDDPGTLYEGTGLVGRSELRELDAATGAVRRAVPLPDGLFGEGITVVGSSIWQLTWQNGVALEWDRATFTLRREVPIAGEGWGLCAEPGRLVRSDGTERLRFQDPGTFAETGSVAVTLDGAPVPDLNELECVDGAVWANVWRTDRIVRIDPTTGAVTAVVDASGLLDPARRANTDVLNGIAHLSGDEYLLTGKLWPAAFRVRLPG
ncbi:glutaminyl-peptide cyclotransferase [Pseudonocardia sp. RS11V-5]|uniref:glutaminyl-peptide cyclotransferase n=1 Tax=Pseudonocardia terrae TaxID=2905831 RepID=UPI001E572070|nr:glutaminyl-peptide cyclotransferase [Pseudonocardia terrae]MCE3556324.1 glutaminyl-peptide cyclotransferase [Pseudonocardia terrae]